MSELVKFIDTIQESADDAEYDVCMGLLKVYNKQLRMIEEGVDFTYFDDIIQEADEQKQAAAQPKDAPKDGSKGVIDQAKGNANESKFKRILLFIPRLIAAILKKAFNAVKKLRNGMAGLQKEIKAKNPDAYAGKTFEFHIILTPNLEEGKQGVISQLQFPRTLKPLNRILSALNNYLENNGQQRIDSEHVGTDSVFCTTILDKDIALIQDAAKNRGTVKIPFVDAENAVSFVGKMQKLYDSIIVPPDITKALDQLREVIAKYNEKINDANVGAMVKGIMQVVIQAVQPVVDKFAQLSSELMNASALDMGEFRRVLNINEDGEAAKNADKDWNGEADEIKVLDNKTLSELLNQYVNQQQHVLVIMIYHPSIILKDSLRKIIEPLKQKYPIDGNPIAIVTYTPGDVGEAKNAQLVRVIKSKQVSEPIKKLFDKEHGLFKYAGQNK